MAFVIVHLLWFIRRSQRVNREVLSAGISCYVLIGMLTTGVFYIAILISRLVALHTAESAARAHGDTAR